MSSFMLLLCVLLLLLINLCYGIDYSSRARNFSIELLYFTKLEHFVMSPFCIWKLMTGAYFGTLRDREIQDALRIPNKRSEQYDIIKNMTEFLSESNANGIELKDETFLFEDRDIKIRILFKAILTSIYEAKNYTLDFQDIRNTANIANQEIQNFFPTIRKVFYPDDFLDASLLMSNIIYFRGRLSTPFDSSNTYLELIYDGDRTPIGQVNMMHHKGKLPYINFESLNSNVLELSYGDNGKVCMLVIMPYEGIKPVDVYLKFLNVSLRDIINKLDKHVKEFGLKEVDIKIPRFDLTSSLNLQRPLNDLGIYNAFSPKHSQFPGLSKDNLYIHSIDHMARITFTETETIVYATTPGYYNNYKPISSYKMKAKQPFIYFLVQKPTATLLFGGIYSRYG